MSRVFVNGPGRVLPKIQKMVLDAAFLALRIITLGSRVT